MLRGEFRPWGLLHWTLDKLPEVPWSVIGTISTEERCLSTWLTIKNKGLLDKLLLMYIEDPESPDSLIAEQEVEKITGRFVADGGDLRDIKEHKLFEKANDTIDSIRSFGDIAGDNVVIDISSFPKRFFFLVIKFILRNENIRNVIATYTIPDKYADEGQPLARDAESWRHIPTFMPPYPEPQEKELIVGVGYEPLGLPLLLEGKGFGGSSVKLLFPFPTPPEGFQRNWNFIRQLGLDNFQPRYEILRVNTHNVSEIFDRISTISDIGRRYSVLAPFGPKPISLAMCLHAISSKYSDESRASVYYTQPRVYHPKYSEGVKMVNGLPVIYSYCLRLNGVDLY